MRGVESVFGADAQVRGHHAALAPDHHIVVEKGRRHVMYHQRRRVVGITDENEDQAVGFAHRVGAQFLPADDRTVFGGGDGAQHAVAEAIGEAMMPE